MARNDDIPKVHADAGNGRKQIGGKAVQSSYYPTFQAAFWCGSKARVWKRSVVEG